MFSVRSMHPAPLQRRLVALLGAFVLVAALAAPTGAQRPDDPPGQLIELQLLAFNDYHGHLEASTSGTVGKHPAGGGQFLAADLNRLRHGHENTLTVAAGDLIGGSPFLSGLFHDEPSVESLNAMGLDVSSVGNHEFDEGVTELLRMQIGGCHPEDGCYFPGDPYTGADFQWLAANVVNDETGETALPPFSIKTIEGVKVGFIGMTLEGTPQLVAQAGITGWSFEDEVATANALVPELKELGVETIVVLLHEGGTPEDISNVNGCVGISGPILAINAGLDAEIDALITGHTHLPYNCVLNDPAGDPRTVTSAFSFGRVISEINLAISPTTGDVVRDQVEATNHIVRQNGQPDPAVTAVLNKWLPLAEVVGNVEVGSASEPITRAFIGESEDRGSESDLSNLIADAQQWATAVNGAQVAFMNPGGVRADFDAGPITYAEAFNVQPFGNLLTTIPMTGAQIHDVLAEQCQPEGSSRPFLHLGVSDGFTYDLSKTIADGTCTSVTISNVELGGVAVPDDASTSYFVTVNNFLVDGGDNFGTFATVDPSLRVGAGIDLDALVAYLTEFSPVSAPGTDRVNELN